MNNTIKQKYSPCELSVVEFKVERGFAQSGEMRGDLIPSGWGSATSTSIIMSMNKNQSTGDFQNNQYTDASSDITWDINFQ